jgi:hypothetical protein
MPIIKKDYITLAMKVAKNITVRMEPVGKRPQINAEQLETAMSK